MRITSSATCITWIPSEAVKGVMKLPFSVGIAHYDDPPPDSLGADVHAALVELRDADRFRIANHLVAWIDVEDGRITDWGLSSQPLVGATTMKAGKAVTVAAVGFEPVVSEPKVGDGWVRFRQSAGGRTGVPAPRHVNRPPFVQIAAPTAWSTVELTVYADGRSEVALAGASPFPRHWLYDESGALVQKSGMIDFKNWYRHAFGKHSPWGDEDSVALATEVETALERQLSLRIMREGRKPKLRRLKAGEVLVSEGEQGNEMFLVLDGVLSVDVGSRPVAELGPGSVVGERALLEGGRRTSTLTALTEAKVAAAQVDDLDPSVLEELRQGHQRELAV